MQFDRSPAAWAARWGVKLLEPIPVKGPAVASDWETCALDTVRYPGRNHPRVGRWLFDRYKPQNGLCADPMIGAGGLWLRTNVVPYGCDVSGCGLQLVHQNLCEDETDRRRVQVANAETWMPSRCVDLVLFSPPFAQNHSAGATAHQQEIRERKNLHAMQAFSHPPPNMAKVYGRVRMYCTGTMAVILRNRIKKGKEVDEVGVQIALMWGMGWEVVGVHSRDLLRPTGYQQWKVSRDPSTPWITHEWAVVAI